MEFLMNLSVSRERESLGARNGAAQKSVVGCVQATRGADYATQQETLPHVSARKLYSRKLASWRQHMTSKTNSIVARAITKLRM